MLAGNSRKMSFRVHVFKEGIAASLVTLKRWFKIFDAEFLRDKQFIRKTKKLRKKYPSCSESSVSCKDLGQIFFFLVFGLHFPHFSMDGFELNRFPTSFRSSSRKHYSNWLFLKLFTILLCIYFVNASCNLDNNSSQSSLLAATEL